MALRFLIVEDHPLYAEALQLTIRSSFPDAGLVHAGNLKAAKSELERDIFDLVLLDLLLPDTDGFKGLVELRGLSPRTPVLVTSVFEDRDVIHNSIVCGASGFVPKSATKNELVGSIQNILAGDFALAETYLPPFVRPRDGGRLLPYRPNSLTPQQLRILHMLCRGLPNKQIAHLLRIRVTTVKAHISEILRKLSVATRTQAVLKVSELSLISVLAFYADDVRFNDGDFGGPIIGAES